MRERSHFAGFMTALLASGSMAWAWGSYPHWVAAQPSIRQQANLPDYWGTSFKIHWENIEPYADIVPLFPWTHACLRNGRVGGVPRTPSTYGQNADGKAPEDDMLVLINALTPSHRSVPLIVETALGCRCHNRLDSCAHFGLFPGGSISAWLQHKELEQYADFLIYELETGIQLEGTDGTVAVRISSAGDPGIILLAQKVFRKARHPIDSSVVPENEREGGVVQPLATIAMDITWSREKKFSGAGKTAARLLAREAMGSESALAAREAEIIAAWTACKAGAQ